MFLCVLPEHVISFVQRKQKKIGETRKKKTVYKMEMLYFIIKKLKYALEDLPLSVACKRKCVHLLR